MDKQLGKESKINYSIKNFKNLQSSKLNIKNLHYQHLKYVWSSVP